MQQTGTIGIIGGGQLGRMLTEAALPLGFKVVVLDPVENSPAAQAGATQIVKDYTTQALTELANQSNYLTTEFEEGLDLATLEHLAQSGATLNPLPRTIATILDKVTQKDYLSEQGIAMGPYKPFETAAEAQALLEEYGGKMLIKTRTGGYDGYGNRLVTDQAGIESALKDFAGQAVYAEAFVPFDKELAVMAVRNLQGDIVTYPVVETVQRNNICHEVLVPAKVSEAVRGQAEKIAVQVAEHFEGAGAFGVEMFLTKDARVLLNEVAPRVHNSGHYSIEACETPQFENHIRAISGMPLGPTDLKVPAAVMINLLGSRQGKAEPSGIEQAEADGHTKVHIYGKAETRPGRKMGHLTSVGDTVEAARDFAKSAIQSIHI